MANRLGPNGKCQVCRHPECTRVEYLLSAGTTVGAVAKRFELSPDATWRHWRRHVSSERKTAIAAGRGLRLAELAERAAAEGESLIDHFAALRSVLYGAIFAASEVGDRHSVAALSGRAVEVLTAMARLSGTLLHGASVNITQNILVSPDYWRVRTAVVQALARHPEARADVLRALRAAEPAPQLEVARG